jgi:copper resistance protein B
MRTKLLWMASCLMLAQPALAEDMGNMSPADMAAEHGGGIFHMFRSETDYGGNKDGAIASWDVKGWVGTDEDKLYLKTEGEHIDGKLDTAEFWALYSRNVATFWDAQVGIRYDDKPKSTTYLALGFVGLAPYYFETEAHLFVSDKGHVSARLREENDFLLTQKLIVQPATNSPGNSRLTWTSTMAGNSVKPHPLPKEMVSAATILSALSAYGSCFN